MKKLLTTAIVTTILTLNAVPAYADTGYGVLPYGTGNCQPSYGQDTCASINIVLNKTVQDPKSGNFVDNLGMNDAKFNPGQNVTFHLDVTNPGKDALSNITVSDTLPQYISYVSGGNFDSKNNIITFSLDHLNSNETKEFTLVGKTADTNNLPSDQGVTCVTNVATAKVSGAESTDNAAFCIQKPVLGTTTKGGLPVFQTQKPKSTPATGPESLPLLGLISSGMVGFLLRRKTK